MKTGEVVLYPSNWIYNAGVVGFLEVFAANHKENKEINEKLLDDGSFLLPMSLFSPVVAGKKSIPRAMKYLVDHLVTDDELEDWLDDDQRNKYSKFEKDMGVFGYKFIRTGNKLFQSKTPYQTLIQPNEWQSLEFAKLLIDLPKQLFRESQTKCGICKTNAVEINDPNSKLQIRLSKLQFGHLTNLAPSGDKFPNSYWNNEFGIPVCILCNYLIIHHHLAFIRLSDGSEVFVNTPSFKLMYYLNRFIRKAFGKGLDKSGRTNREILAMSVIEYASKIKAMFGVWAGMNIEIISKRKNAIEFFNLPYEIIRILADRDIASLLSSIGEFRVLNLVLQQHYTKIIEDAYRLMRIGIKNKKDRNKSENKFLSDYFRIERNLSNPKETAEKMLKLYALIEQKSFKERR